MYHEHSIQIIDMLDLLENVEDDLGWPTFE